MQEIKPHMKNRAVTVMKAKRVSVRAVVLVIGLFWYSENRLFLRTYKSLSAPDFHGLGGKIVSVVLDF